MTTQPPSGPFSQLHPAFLEALIAEMKQGAPMPERFDALAGEMATNLISDKIPAFFRNLSSVELVSLARLLDDREVDPFHRIIEEELDSRFGPFCHSAEKCDNALCPEHGDPRDTSLDQWREPGEDDTAYLARTIFGRGI